MLIAERWIQVRLRNMPFFSVEALNAVITELPDVLNGVECRATTDDALRHQTTKVSFVRCCAQRRDVGGDEARSKTNQIDPRKWYSDELSRNTPDAANCKTALSH